MNWRIRQLVLIAPAALAVLFAAIVSQAKPVAQSPDPVTEGDASSVTYRVVHDHAVGSGNGELTITPTGIEYRGTGDHEALDSRTWNDTDIKRLELHSDRIKVYGYEAARIPILPPIPPFSHDSKAVRGGSERKWEFRLLDKHVDGALVSLLLERFTRPIGTSVLPDQTDLGDAMLFEVPVFHRHRRGGESGLFRVFERHVEFRTEADGHSRWWRYADIRDIGRVGRMQLDLATFEDQFGTDGKSYLFDLKRPMTGREYDALWKRLYDVPVPK